MTRLAADGRLHGASEDLAVLTGAGIGSVGQVLDAADAVRELPDRSNHVLRVDGRVWYVKRNRRRPRRGGLPAEAAALRRLADAGVTTARLAFHGVDRDRGAITGTAALEPASPLDTLLVEQPPSVATQRVLTRRLALLVAALHDASLHHKDLYLNHVFADAARPDAGPWLIDVERVARHRRALGRWVVKDLAALRHSVPPGTLSEARQTRFLVAYLAARGIPRRGVARGLARRIRAKARRMARHVPRTPVGEAARPTGGATP